MSPSKVRCDFCGYEFDPACTESGCEGCPLSKGCSRVVCPHCGYEMLPEAALIGLIRRIKASWRKSSQPAVDPKQNQEKIQ